MQVKSCVSINPISLPVHHMGTPQELVARTLCGSTDQKLIFCLICCPQLTENILPLTGHWTGSLLLRDVPFT